MKHPISEIAFTPVVKAAQEKRGSRNSYAKMEHRGAQGPWRDVVTPDLAQYIAERDPNLAEIPNANVKLLERAGHFASLDAPDALAAAVLDFAG